MPPAVSSEMQNKWAKKVGRNEGGSAGSRHSSIRILLIRKNLCTVVVCGGSTQMASTCCVSWNLPHPAPTPIGIPGRLHGTLLIRVWLSYKARGCPCCSPATQMRLCLEMILGLVTAI
ncbi:unnamed protein product [Rangifer tarandus platyrhynchus]|uniref:Uncharacterized protein n=2 Tax=Rangifer tarandus platyrhynchus TaxID=3082113 RepID=A0ABN8YG81_RANTA|nr:unnamed protein product [Rangifer tarandus platyrhynchus]